MYIYNIQVHLNIIMLDNNIILPFHITKYTSLITTLSELTVIIFSLFTSKCR